MPLHRAQNSQINLTPESLTLLLNTQPTFQALARISSWRSPPRQLQLRANVLLLLRPAQNPSHNTIPKLTKFTTASIDRLHILSTSHKPFISPSSNNSSSTSVTIGIETYEFPDATSAATFRDAVSSALSLYATAPNYIVKGPVPYYHNFQCFGKYVMARTTINNNDIDSHISYNNDIVTVKTFEKSDLSKEEIKIIISERISLQKIVQANLRSPFLPSFIHSFETKTQLAIVTDVNASLGNVRTLLRRVQSKKIPQKMAKIIFCEMLLSIIDIHSAGILFGGISPEFVLLTANGHVKLSDFSKSVYSSTYGIIDDEGKENMIVGTLTDLNIRKRMSIVTKLKELNLMDISYMSPEELSGKTKWNNAKSDAWALGVTLYEMVTGHKPFGISEDVKEMSNRIKHKKLKFPEYLDFDLKMVLISLLMKDESKRPSLKKVQKMDWFRDINWMKIRHNAQNDVPNDQLIKLALTAGIVAEEIDLDMGLSSGVVDVEIESEDDIDYEDEEEDDDDDARSEWSRMTREFCRVDGVETIGAQGMQRGRSLTERSQGKKMKWWEGGKVLPSRISNSNIRDRRNESHHQLLGFGLKASSK